MFKQDAKTKNTAHMSWLRILAFIKTTIRDILNAMCECLSLSKLHKSQKHIMNLGRDQTKEQLFRMIIYCEHVCHMINASSAGFSAVVGFTGLTGNHNQFDCPKSVSVSVCLLPVSLPH